MLLSDVPGFGGEEANVVFTVQQRVAGGPLYADPSKPPFTITQYAPLFYLVSASLARAGGIDASDPGGITLVCRLVSLGAALAVAGLVVGVARRLKVPLAVGLLVAAFCLVSSVPWHFLARPDALTSFFLVLSIYLVLGVDPARPMRAHLAAAAAVLAAFLAAATKQSGVQALGLVLLYLLLARAWKQLATALLSAAALVGLLLALIDPLQNWLGPALKENLIDGVRNGLDPIAALERTFAPFFRQFAFLVALAALAGLASLRKGTPPAPRFLALAALLLLGFACSTGLKAGSCINYFVDFVIVASLAAAVYCCRRPEAAEAEVPGLGRAVPALALGFVLFFLPVTAVDQFDRHCYAYSLPRGLRPDPRRQFGASANVARFLRERLDGRPDTFVLTGECFCVGTQLFPYTVVPQPRIARLSHELKVVDYGEFRACVAGGKVGYLVTRAGTKPAPFLGASFDDYHLVRELDGYAVYQFVPGGVARGE
jgi:hypothetical protein